MKGGYDEGQGNHEAVRRKASAWQQIRGTDLKMKRQIRPRRVTVELLTNVKVMGVILHGLRPVLINR
jgi:ribosomal protein L32E